MKGHVLIFLLFISQLIFAQGFNGGVFGGMTISQVDGDRWAGYNKVGLQIGAYSRYLFNEKWSTIVELKYIQKGSIHNEKDNPYAYFRIRLNYIEIPILLNFQLKEHLAFGAGISYAQLINAQVDDASGTVADEQLVYKKMDINVIGQLKYLLNEHLWADLKYAYSIVYITNESPRQYNNLISLGVGYEF